MNSKTFPKSGRRAIVAAIAVLAPLALANAAELNLSAIGNHVQAPTPGAITPSFDRSQYEQLNLSAIGATIWVAKRGAQGPLRSDGRDPASAQDQAQWQAADRELQARLGPVGGNGTN
jgi:hypothetical protein